VSAPLTHQSRAGLRHDTGIEGATALLELSGQGLQAAPLRPAGAAIGLLLQLMGEGSDQQMILGRSPVTSDTSICSSQCAAGAYLGGRCSPIAPPAMARDAQCAPIIPIWRVMMRLLA